MSSSLTGPIPFSFWSASIVLPPVPASSEKRCLECFPVGREGMHHVGEDRQGNLGPDGEGNLAHPAGRVRPHRDRADQHPALGVELDAAEVIVAQLSPGGVAEAELGP